MKIGKNIFMKTLTKAISPLISFVLIIAIGITSISVVLIAGKPLIDRILESMIVNEAFNNMNILSNAIREVASGGTGVLIPIRLSVSDGRYGVDNFSNSLYFDYTLKSGIIEPGTFTKQGDIQIIAGGAGAKAFDNGTSLILENEILKLVLNKVGNPANWASLNTKDNIKSIQNKKTGLTIIPKDSSILIGNDASSSFGNGYSKLVMPGNNLPLAEAIFFVNTTNYQYTILYSLPSLSDYFTVQIQNTTNTNNTFNFRYNISVNGFYDIFNIGGNVYNMENITNNKCWTKDNISNYFSCSYYNNNLTGLIYSGAPNQFINICFSNSTTDYIFNLTSNTLQKIIIPLALGTCSDLANKYYLVTTYGQPTTSFSNYPGLISQIINLRLKLNYPNIILTGDGNTIGKGTHKLCIEKIGVSNNLPVVNIRRC